MYCKLDENGDFVSRSSSSSAILRDEVKYVHTDTDLLAMEKAARGKKDIVLGYVRSLGTQGMKKEEWMDTQRQNVSDGDDLAAD